MRSVWACWATGLATSNTPPVISALDIPTTEVPGDKHTLPFTIWLELAGALVIVVAARIAQFAAVCRTSVGVNGGGGGAVLVTGLVIVRGV